MNKDTIHPQQLKILLGSLPVGCEFINAEVVSPTTSKVVFSRSEGQEVTIPFEKTSVVSRLGAYPLTVEVVNGEPMDDVIQRFSKLYGFPILKDVDYTPVGSAEIGKLASVELLDSSLLFIGTLSFDMVPSKPKAAKVWEVDLEPFKKALPK